MILFSYKTYPYAPKASLFSVLSVLFSYCGLIGGICLALFFFFGNVEKTTGLIRGIIGLLVLALAAFLYFYVYRKIVPAMAEKESDVNIHTKARFAYNYCQKHPEAFDQLQSENPDFAAKYQRNEAGKIVKIK